MLEVVLALVEAKELLVLVALPEPPVPVLVTCEVLLPQAASTGSHA